MIEGDYLEEGAGVRHSGDRVAPDLLLRVARRCEGRSMAESKRIGGNSVLQPALSAA